MNIRGLLLLISLVLGIQVEVDAKILQEEVVRSIRSMEQQSGGPGTTALNIPDNIGVEINAVTEAFQSGGAAAAVSHLKTLDPKLFPAGCNMQTFSEKGAEKEHLCVVRRTALLVPKTTSLDVPFIQQAAFRSQMIPNDNSAFVDFTLDLLENQKTCTGQKGPVSTSEAERLQHLKEGPVTAEKGKVIYSRECVNPSMGSKGCDVMAYAINEVAGNAMVYNTLVDTSDKGRSFQGCKFRNDHANYNAVTVVSSGKDGTMVYSLDIGCFDARGMREGDPMKDTIQSNIKTTKQFFSQIQESFCQDKTGKFLMLRQALDATGLEDHATGVLVDNASKGTKKAQQ